MTRHGSATLRPHNISNIDASLKRRARLVKGSKKRETSKCERWLKFSSVGGCYCSFIQRLWILNATVLANGNVLRLMQLRKDSLFITIGDAALKLKHGAD